MVRKASQYNYAVDTTYDEINMHEEESHAVFLSMNEIARIINLSIRISVGRVNVSEICL